MYSFDYTIHLVFKFIYNTNIMEKRSCVIPIHKKGDCHLVGNYRPIMLTSIIGKVLESSQDPS